MTSHVKPICLRQILRDARRIAPDRQPVVLHLLRATVEAALREDFPGCGERLRLYVPHVDQQQRAARRHRILQALQAGEAPRLIARRERVSEQWVRQLRATARP